MEMSNQIGGLISLLIGAASGIILGWTLIRQIASRNWSVAQGKILECRLDYSQDSYKPCVRYDYVVRGQTYTNNKISLVNLIYEDKKQAEKIVAPYFVGKTVNVYYDTQKPSDSFLEKRNLIWLYLFLIIFTSIFIVVGVGLMSQTQ